MLDSQTDSRLGLYAKAKKLADQHQQVQAQLAAVAQEVPELPSMEEIANRADAELASLAKLVECGSLEDKHQLVRLYVKGIKVDPKAQRLELTVPPALSNWIGTGRQGMGFGFGWIQGVWMSDVPESSGKSELPPEGGAGASGMPAGGTGSGSTGATWIYSGLPVTGYYPQPAVAPPAAGASGATANSGATAAESGWSAGAAIPAAAPAAPPMPPVAAPMPFRPAAGKTSGSGTKAAEKKESDASLASVIDTIEAIIIALIIALTFRAFIVEAFVIPTGSMAPTLLGAHFKAVCPKCGYEFDVDANVGMQAVMGPNGQMQIPQNPDRAAELRSNTGVPVLQDIYCPNCRYLISPKELPQPIKDGPVNGFTFAWANNGDRILVLKYLYAVMEPKRWDVIVFKEPQEAQSNYIKRCIGLPHDTIQIVNGDIYVGHGKEGEQDPKQRHIERKPEELQQSLWQLVYDNDYYPNDEGKARKLPGRNDQPDVRGGEPWMNPWEPAAGEEKDWKKGTTMQYAGAGQGALWFNLMPSRAIDYPPYTLNTLGYNGDFYFNPQDTPTPHSIIGDLRLETVWTPAKADGAKIQLTLGRPNNCFQVTWDNKGLALLKYDSVKQVFQTVSGAAIAAGMAAPAAETSYRLAFNNVDHAVQFYIDGKEALTYQEDWNAEQAMADNLQYPSEWVMAGDVNFPGRAQQDQSRANSMISIDVGGACNLSHLKLMRDLYYTQVNQGPGTGTETKPVTLGEDEFFACGDNSRRSSDGRMWSSVYEPLGDLSLRPGIVPRRYLLGKAFFVYWPAGYRASDSLPVLQNLPLVPNTGDMRLIR